VLDVRRAAAKWTGDWSCSELNPHLGSNGQTKDVIFLKSHAPPHTQEPHKKEKKSGIIMPGPELSTPQALAGTFALVTCVKLLLMESYHSTDYEVHRNWLAIAASLRPSKWYFDTTSMWSLDYPPLFAFFERALVPIARVFDPEMARVENLDYLTRASHHFMRLSVICTDVALGFGTWCCCSGETGFDRRGGLLTLLNGGLLLVDHIHFQYNGFLFGILLMSIGLLRKSEESPGRGLAGGALFAGLLVLKHLFLPMAPVFFVHLLGGFCRPNGCFRVGRFLALALSVVFVIACPFMLLILDHSQDSGASFVVSARLQLQQIRGRLFPFSASSSDCQQSSGIVSK